MAQYIIIVLGGMGRTVEMYLYWMASK